MNEAYADEEGRNAFCENYTGTKPNILSTEYFGQILPE